MLSQVLMPAGGGHRHATHTSTLPFPTVTPDIPKVHHQYSTEVGHKTLWYVLTGDEMGRVRNTPTNMIQGGLRADGYFLSRVLCHGNESSSGMFSQFPFSLKPMNWKRPSSDEQTYLKAKTLIPHPHGHHHDRRLPVLLRHGNRGRHHHPHDDHP